MDLQTAQILAIVLANAAAVFLVAKLMPGIAIRGFGTSILVAIVYGVLNWLLWWPVALLSLPLVVLSFGLFLVAINGLLLMLTAKIVPDFYVSGCITASIAGLLITLASGFFRGLFMPHGIPIFWR